MLHVLAGDVQQHADVGVVGGVEDHLAGASRAHQAVGAQHAQVVADVALAHVHGRGEVADAELAGLDDRRHEPAAALVGEHLEDGGHLLRPEGVTRRARTPCTARGRPRDVAVVQEVLVVLAADDLVRHGVSHLLNV